MDIEAQEAAPETVQETQEPSSNSLLNESEPLGEGEYFLSNGVKGSGDMPEWYQASRYKSVADQAKAYTELEKKFGGFTGAPKDGYKGPEGIDGEDALYKEFLSYATETNMSQKAFDKGFALLQAQMGVNESVTIEGEMAKLGENAEGRISHINQYISNNLKGEAAERVKEMVTDARSVELIEALIGATAQPNLPKDSEGSVGMSKDELDSLMFAKDEHGNFKRSIDPAYEKKVQKALESYANQLQR
jgi:hypothetical protein